MSKIFDLIAVGYPSVDRIIKLNDCPEVGKTSIVQNQDHGQPYYGGCNVNIAYLCSKMGMNTLPLMRVGRDFKEIGFEGFLEESGIDTNKITRVEEDITSNTHLVTTGDGHHITLFYPGAMDNKYETKIDEEMVKSSKYGIITVGNPEYNMEFARICIKNNIPMVFGMKCDLTAFPDKILKSMLENSEIIFMNEGEKRDIEKRMGYKNIKDLFCDAKAKCIIVTKGSRGSEVIYLEEGSIQTESIDVVKPDRVMDTTGVGDAYIAGFMYGHLHGKGFIEAAKVGSVFSSFIIEEMGCLSNTPTIKQVDKRYQDNYGGRL